MAVERHQKRGRGRPSLEEVLTTVDEEVALLHDHLGGLPRDVEADEVLHEIWLDDVHNSTAIEGNTISRPHNTHPIIHETIHHAWYERIHPFVDGNGRVGRLLLNFILAQNGYPPAVILATERRRYLQALGTDDAKNPHPLAEVIARAVS